MKYIDRFLETTVLNSLENFPVTAIVGPRQCGKSTLIKHLSQHRENKFLYLDLERPSDLEKLRDAEWFLGQQKDKLICIDEIQRRPELFPLLRSLVDEWNKPGCFVVLGSASHELLEQSSESLAGRIVYRTLTPFLWDELTNQNDYKIELQDYILKGGFPRETVVLANLKGHFPDNEIFFYRTSNRAEIDFVIKYKQFIFAIECKASHAPQLSKGNYNALKDIQPDYTFVVIPDKEGWPMQSQIDVVSLDGLINRIKNFKK